MVAYSLFPFNKQRIYALHKKGIQATVIVKQNAAVFNQRKGLVQEKPSTGFCETA